MRLKLKPCPFCGQPAAIKQDYGTFAVCCNNTFCSVHAATIHCRIQEAAKIWNKRADKESKPKYNGEKNMNFMEALEHLKRGKFVRLPEWASWKHIDERYLYVAGGDEGFILQGYKDGGDIVHYDTGGSLEWRPLTLSEYLRTDWEVVEE